MEVRKMSNQVFVTLGANRSETSSDVKKKKWISVDDKLPQNLQRVLVATETDEGEQKITVAQYVAPRSVLSRDYIEYDWMLSEYDEELDEYFAPSGFYENNYYSLENYYIDDKVTHWMPLPNPPKMNDE